MVAAASMNDNNLKRKLKQRSWW